MLDVETRQMIREILKHQGWRMLVLRSLGMASHLEFIFDSNLANGCTYDREPDHCIEDCRLFEDFFMLMMRRDIV